jgi:hypothetical protein
MHYHLPIACLRGDPLSINQLVAKGHLSFQWCGESGEVFQFFRMKGMELQYFFGGLTLVFTSFFSITCLSHVRRIFKIDGLTIVAGSAVSTHMEHTTSRNEYKANNKSEKYGQQPQWNVMDQWTTQSLYTFYIYV